MRVLLSVLVACALLASCARDASRPSQNTPGPAQPLPQPGPPAPSAPQPTPTPAAPAPRPPEAAEVTADVLDGFTEKQSYLPGETVHLFLDVEGSVQGAVVRVYDVRGERTFAFTVPALAPQGDVARTADRGFDYHESAEFSIPATLKSGVYMIENKVPLIVRSRDASLPVLVINTNTLNAYNCQGGASAYALCPGKQVVRLVSFRRPMNFAFGDAKVITSSAFAQWALEQNFDFNYVSDADLEDFEVLRASPLLILQDHSEYWTRGARQNFDRFVAAGGNAAIFSGNSMWWQVRFEDGGDTMAIYRDARLDPAPDPLDKTIEWFQPSLAYPTEASIGGNFNLGGYAKPGASFYGLKVQDENNVVFAGTGIEHGRTLPYDEDGAAQRSVVEYDGAPVVMADGVPALKPDPKWYRRRLLGYDTGQRTVSTVGTFLALQKTPTSGVIVDMATTAWGYALRRSPDRALYARITRNVIEALLTDPQSVLR